MRAYPLFYSGVAILILLGVRGTAAWSDPTAGLAALEYQSSRELGTEAQHWFVQEDSLGRLYVGGAGLQVFDGVAWKTHSIGGAQGVRTMQFGADGRLWVGALNELGYLTEPTLGAFAYHSLLSHLPESERFVGHIWGSGLVGGQIFFMGKEKLYRWDGQAFRIWSFPGQSRLFPLQLDGETWFHHRESGLYRITVDGPVLMLDPSQLPDTGILGLSRDQTGLLLISSLGIFNPGAPPRPAFAEEINRYILTNRLTVYRRLANGNHLIGTLNGGLLILDANGHWLRVIDGRDHPMFQTPQSLAIDRHGQVWCATPQGIFHFDPSGAITVFNARNGLDGGSLTLETSGRIFYAGNGSGTYQLSAATRGSAQFTRIVALQETYTTMQTHADGLLLGRHGGLDYFDSQTVSPIYSVLANGIYLIVPSRQVPGTYLLSEGDALVRLTPGAAGKFTHEPFGHVPDFVRALTEDTQGRVWTGTVSLGAWIVNPQTTEATPVHDPATGQPLKGQTGFSRSKTDLLLFASQQILRAEPDGTALRTLLPLPGIEPTAIATGSDRTTLLAFKRTGTSQASSWGQGLGRMQIGADGAAAWQELDVPALESLGLVQSLKLTVENGRSILWVGGTDGLLRLDYAAIPVATAPTAPLIRVDLAQTGGEVAPDLQKLPFDGHRLSFQVFTGDPARQRDWLVQTRLGQSDSTWSAPTGLRTYAYSNLSEGTYRFEARAINAAGLTSAPAVFTFRILPPWYRSKAAYAGYALALALAGWGTIRLRERRIIAQNERLETQVQERTAELVKANAAKDEFLAGVSHEIRNPMNGVIGIAETLQASQLDEVNRHKFGLLRQCAAHLGSLLEDLLSLSKMQAGVIELELTPFRLPELVDSVAAMAAADSEKFKIPLSTAISPGVPTHLVGDPRRIRQILLNFVSNALKFSGRGRVEVTVWCQPAVTPGRTEVIFAVSDDGPGISAEEQARLFQRFERGAAARGGRVAGTGLGLALCKGYAEKMGGRIWLESEPGHGACFNFSVPLELAAAPDEPNLAATSTDPENGQQVLVVDDQEYNRIVLCDLLTRLGYITQSTGSGAEALELAGRQDYALIFLDYDLPGMSGLDIARGLRALPGGSARATIFATTAFNTPEKQRQCRAAGMDAFLGKPVTLERLRKVLAAETPAAGPTPIPAPPAPPTDGLANLRMLATKKQVRFQDEVALYLSELQVEFTQLEAAVQREDPTEAAHYAHRLCGRSSFIYERELEHVLRQLEEAAARERWPEARRHCAALPALVADLRLRMVSSGPAAPPA